MDATNPTRSPVELPGGRLLGAYETAEGLEVTEETRGEFDALEAAGSIILSDPERDPLAPEHIGGETIESVLALVGDDEERRARALASEGSRGEKARTSLVEKLQPPTPEDD